MLIFIFPFYKAMANVSCEVSIATRVLLLGQKQRYLFPRPIDVINVTFPVILGLVEVRRHQQIM